MMHRSHTLPWLLAALVACGPGKSDEGGGGDSEGTTVDPGTSTSGPTTLGMSSTVSAGTDPTAAPGDPTEGATGTTAAPPPPPPPDDGTTSTTSAPDGTTTIPGTASFDPSTEGGSSFVPPDPERVFITEVDGLPDFLCDPWIEDCDVGEKCMPFDSGSGTWDALKCVPLDARPQQVGEPCVMDGDSQSGIDNCAKHAMCWNVGDDLEGTCIGMCEGSPQDPSCPPGFGCSMSNGGALNVCLAHCDPLAQDCAAGETCVGFGVEFFCVADASGVEGQLFDPCEFINTCDPGLFCAAPEFGPGCDLDVGGCCLPHCDLSEAQSCPQGLDCVPWFEDGEAPDGLQDVGACVSQ